MRILICLIFIVCFLSSCCSTKGVIENTSKPIAKNKDVVIKKSSAIDKDTIKINEIIPRPSKSVDIEDLNIKLDKKPKVSSHNSFNSLLNKYVSKEGNVNYKSLKKTDTKTLRIYIETISNNLPNNNWTKNEKLAYWINAYNALTIDLILRHYPLKSIKDIKDPWDQRFWKLGDKWYNLNEIEHQILRKMSEPRIHFAIVCASFSCPKLKNEAYTSENLDEQLSEATKTFLTDDKRNSISHDHLELSKIFQWFAKDFKQDGSLIDFLNKYSDIEISEKAKKRFKDYNWDLNE